MKAPVVYWPGCFSSIAKVHHLDTLDWERFGSTPRDEYYAAKDGRDYAYNAYGGMRTYRSKPITSQLERIWEQAEKLSRTKFDAVFLNRYRVGRDHLGWHSDDGETMDDSRPIAIVSFGAEREIWFRERPELGGSTEVEKLLLESGSIAIMAAGMQDTHQHRIPKASSKQVGERISLTFRGVV